MSRIKQEFSSRDMEYFLRKENRLKFMPRTENLRRFEGWYKTLSSPLYEMYVKSGSKLKFSRWLAANGIDPGSGIGKSIANASKQVSFKFTCRYEDILRCSTMYKHEYFNSCLKSDGINCWAPLRYVCLERSKYIGMIYVPDAAGHIRSRCFVIDTPNGLYPLRFYGEDPLASCFDAIQNKAKENGWKYLDFDSYVEAYQRGDGDGMSRWRKSNDDPEQWIQRHVVTEAFVAGLARALNEPRYDATTGQLETRSLYLDTTFSYLGCK